MKKIVFTLSSLFCCIASSQSMFADTVPFSIKSELFDSSNTNTLGLSKPEGLETVTVFAPSDNTDHFSHGAVMIGFKGALYCMWQSSQKDEDSADTWIAYSRSTDEGKTWCKPMTLVAPIDYGYCSSGGWWTYGDSLYAYINTWPSNLNPKGGYTRYIKSNDGLTWTQPQDVLMADGSRLDGIFEQDPHALPDGRIVNSAHMQPGLHICPIYTDDPSGVRGWKRGSFQYSGTGDQSTEMEPSWYYKPDGTVVMIFRDQSSSYHKLAAVSTDRGETWSKSVKTNMPDARTKQSAGNLPDGTCFMAGNPVTNKARKPLALTLSKDGTTFDKAYLLRDANSIQPLRYEGKAKSSNSGYSYPKSMVYGNYLYVSYATNKEDVEYSRIPLSSISLLSGLEDVAGDGRIRMVLRGKKLLISGCNGECQIGVYSIDGTLVEQAYCVVIDHEEIDLSPLHSGIYLVRVQTKLGSMTQKVVLK